MVKYHDVSYGISIQSYDAAQGCRRAWSLLYWVQSITSVMVHPVLGVQDREAAAEMILPIRSRSHYKSSIIRLRDTTTGQVISARASNNAVVR